MNKFILQLLSEKTKIEGNYFLIPPTKGFKRKVFNFVSKRMYEKKNKHIEKLGISELKTVLNQTINLFKENNHLFQIDINHSNWSEIQIVHPTMVKEHFNENCENFGFAVHWVFDSMKKTNPELINKMENLFKSENYIHHKYDTTIDCFTFLCGENTELTYRITKTILYEICGYQNGEKYRYSISDNGKL